MPRDPSNTSLNLMSACRQLQVSPSVPSLGQLNPRVTQLGWGRGPGGLSAQVGGVGMGTWIQRFAACDASGGRGRVERSIARGTLPTSRNWLKAGFGAGGREECLGKEDMGRGRLNRISLKGNLQGVGCMDAPAKSLPRETLTPETAFLSCWPCHRRELRSREGKMPSVGAQVLPLSPEQAVLAAPHAFVTVTPG